MQFCTPEVKRHPSNLKHLPLRSVVAYRFWQVLVHVTKLYLTLVVWTSSCVDSAVWAISARVKRHGQSAHVLGHDIRLCGGTDSTYNTVIVDVGPLGIVDCVAWVPSMAFGIPSTNQLALALLHKHQILVTCPESTLTWQTFEYYTLQHNLCV